MPIEAYRHLAGYKNTDRLKAEAAHHNPEDPDPDETLKRILDRYFRFVERARK